MVKRTNMAGKGIFIKFNEVRRGQHGQIMVFLLSVLIILLIAAVSLVQIGKVGIRRLRTANAADSAAIAGASALASVANNIADINYNLRYVQFPAVQAAILFTGSRCIHPICTGGGCLTFVRDLAIYRAEVVNVLMNYIYLMRSTEDGFQAAKAQAHKTVFGSVGIEEAQIRRKSKPEEILQPSLSRWLNEGDFKGSSYTYRWYGYSIDIGTGKESKEPIRNEVTSTVDINDCAYALRPVLLMPIIKMYKFEYSAVTPKTNKDECVDCKCNNCFNTDKAAFPTWLQFVRTQGLIAAQFFAIPLLTFHFFSCQQPDAAHIILEILTALRKAPVIIPQIISPPHKQCVPFPGGECPCPTPVPVLAPKPAYANVYFFIPVPWLNSIANDDNIRLTTQVTYMEPKRKLGFWERRQTSVTSSATARVIPGDFNNIDDRPYDAELTGAH
jgi:hypothetical protein